MKAIKHEINTFEYNEEFLVEIEETKDIEGEDWLEAWLMEKNGGFKSYIVGVPKKSDSIESFVCHLFDNMDEYIEKYESERMRLEVNPDIILDNPINKMYDEIVERTVNNCKRLEEKHCDKALLNEIGVLRGLMYAVEKVSTEAPYTMDIIRYIDMGKNIVEKELDAAKTE